MRSDAPAVPPLPSLAPFLSRLASLVSSPFCPPSLFLHDPKQSPVLVHAILQLIHAGRPPTTTSSSSDKPPQVGDLLPVVAHLDLAQVHSVKQALDRILAQFSGHDLVSSDKSAQWDERNQGVKVWDGHALENLRVVVETSRARKRPAASNDGETRSRKRKRVRRGETQSTATSDSDGDGTADDDAEEDMAGETGPTARWSLEWDPEQAEDQSGSSTQATLAPFRNSLDAFHDSLRRIFTFADKHSSSASPDAEAGLPQRRFIVLEHGELLSELAGAGKASGAAARETGVGVTFASTIHRLAELVSVCALPLLGIGPCTLRLVLTPSSTLAIRQASRSRLSPSRASRGGNCANRWSDCLVQRP